MISSIGSEIKCFELRDRGTFIPVMCVRIDMSKVDEPDRYLLSRGGWGSDQKITYMININDGRCQWDAFCWTLEPYLTAHQHIQDNWDSLKGGEVIDGEFLRGESPVAKESERENGEF
ncbi:MAG: hypothetical protein WC479_09390 [Candidatus Izemoplasmatales bacterium]